MTNNPLGDGEQRQPFELLPSSPGVINGWFVALIWLAQQTTQFVQPTSSSATPTRSCSGAIGDKTTDLPAASLLTFMLTWVCRSPAPNGVFVNYRSFRF